MPDATERQRKRRNRARNAGLCGKCCKRQPDDEMQTCNVCREGQQTEQRRRYAREWMRRKAEAARLEGVCTKCFRNEPQSGTTCESCRYVQRVKKRAKTLPRHVSLCHTTPASRNDQSGT